MTASIYAANSCLEKRLLCLCFFLFSIFICTLKAQNNKWEFEAEAVFRITSLDWSIAGNLEGTSPNILSELNFKNINSLGTNIKVNYIHSKNLIFVIDYQRLWTVFGNGVDSDYENDYRMNPSYREEFSSNKGYVNLGGLAGTYHFLIGENYRIGNGLSLRRYNQKFFLLHESFSNLNSIYNVNSNSLGLSLFGAFALNEKINLESNFMYSILNYRSNANWNLIEVFEQPLSFSQKANGYGLNGRFSFRYLFTKNVNMLLGCLLEMQSSKN